MTKLRIAGVPEHFNLPWHLALEDGAFKAHGVDLEWTDIPEGSGRMSAMLGSGEADLAVILTDGLIKAVADGLPAVILQEYIASPLLWGIHVSADAEFRTEEDLKGTRAAISRFGSGSHLMAYVNAGRMAWDTDELRFQVVDTLEGAVRQLQDGTADYFMWERFTTQPLVDQGVFRRVGVCPTPWPCFVLAVRRDTAEAQHGSLTAVLSVINQYTAGFKEIPGIDRVLADRYGQKIEAIREWLTLTRWSQHQISLQDLENAIGTLAELNLLKNPIKAKDLMTP